MICFLLVDTMSHWFRHIAEGEPCDTYLKLSSGDLARTSEMIETQRSTFDGDDALCVQNLQSIADYIHSAVVSSSSLPPSLPLSLSLSLPPSLSLSLSPSLYLFSYYI